MLTGFELMSVLEKIDTVQNEMNKQSEYCLG